MAYDSKFHTLHVVARIFHKYAEKIYLGLEIISEEDTNNVGFFSFKYDDQ